MELYLRFALTAATVHLIYLLGLLVSCFAQRMPVTSISVFFGPALARLRFAELDVILGIIPSGVSVSISGMSKEESDLQGGFSRRSRFSRASVHIVGVMFIVCFGLFAFGSSHALNELSSGFHQVLFGTWAPVSVGKVYVLDFLKYLEQHSLISGIGLLSLKYAAFCLLPNPLQNMGQAIIELLTSGESRWKILEKVFFVGALLNTIFAVAWFIAISAAVIERANGSNTNTLIAGGIGFISLWLWLAKRDRLTKLREASFRLPTQTSSVDQSEMDVDVSGSES